MLTVNAPNIGLKYNVFRSFIVMQLSCNCQLNVVVHSLLPSRHQNTMFYMLQSFNGGFSTLLYFLLVCKLFMHNLLFIVTCELHVKLSFYAQHYIPLADTTLCSEDTKDIQR